LPPNAISLVGPTAAAAAAGVVVVVVGAGTLDCS
jgi:hypothetical protein